jgi:hypothetical protein
MPRKATSTQGNIKASLDQCLCFVCFSKIWYLQAGIRISILPYTNIQKFYLILARLFINDKLQFTCDHNNFLHECSTICE